tara:strand:+ start:47 stop:460 length:414 start_codon:yes stop_codon:yes gene_type:complete
MAKASVARKVTLNEKEGTVTVSVSVGPYLWSRHDSKVIVRQDDMRRFAVEAGHDVDTMLSMTGKVTNGRTGEAVFRLKKIVPKVTKTTTSKTSNNSKKKRKQKPTLPATPKAVANFNNNDNVVKNENKTTFPGSSEE